MTAIPTSIYLLCTSYYFAFPCDIPSFYTLSYFILSYLVLSYLISSTPHLSLSWTGISKIKMLGWWCSIGWVGKRWYHRLIFSKRKLLIKWRDKIENFKLHLHQSRSNLLILGKPPFYLIFYNYSLLLSFIFFWRFSRKKDTKLK